MRSLKKLSSLKTTISMKLWSNRNHRKPNNKNKTTHNSKNHTKCNKLESVNLSRHSLINNRSQTRNSQGSHQKVAPRICRRRWRTLKLLRLTTNFKNNAKSLRKKLRMLLLTWTTKVKMMRINTVLRKHWWWNYKVYNKKSICLKMKDNRRLKVYSTRKRSSWINTSIICLKMSARNWSETSTLSSRAKMKNINCLNFDQ